VSFDPPRESKWKRILSRAFRIRHEQPRERQAGDTPSVQIGAEALLGRIVVCTPDRRKVGSWVSEVARVGYEVTLFETLSPATEQITAVSPQAILIDPGEQAEAAIQLITRLRRIDSLQSRFIGAIAHLPEEMRSIAKPLLQAGASRVFQPTPARAVQILIGLKIAFAPGRFEKILVPGQKIELTPDRDEESQPTILILEENVRFANILKEMFEDHGFTTEIAFDVGNTLHLLSQSQPQAFLLDTTVPGVNGIYLLKEIRALQKFQQTPIVIFTTAFSSFSAAQLLQAGATHVFDKPETGPAKILEVFKELLGTAKRTKRISAPRGEPVREHFGATVPSGEKAALATASLADDNLFFAEIQESLLQEAPTLVTELQEALDAVWRKASAEIFANLDRKLHALAGNAGLARLARVGSLASATAALVEDLESKAEPLSNSVRKTLTQAVNLMRELFGQADEFMPSKIAVMAVDDEVISRRVLTRALQKVDLQPEVFDNPEKALQRAQESQFELIFLDVDMPGMDGFELCKRIRGLPQYAATPVVFITSRDSLDAHLESARSGGSDFINKPFAIRELAVKALIYLLQKRGQEALKAP
jgi:DNA-binding response OmpR family regulator